MAFDTGFSKSIFQSVTFWGAVLGAVSMAVPTLAGKVGLTSSTVQVDAQYAVQAVAFVVTIIGRFRATQKVTLTGK